MIPKLFYRHCANSLLIKVAIRDPEPACGDTVNSLCQKLTMTDVL
jgi:hypothetical protein